MYGFGYGDNPVEKVKTYIEYARQLYPVEDDQLVGGGKIFYMNKGEDTLTNWKKDGHVCEFEIFYNDGWGYMKFTVKKGGDIVGYAFYPNGNSPAQKIPTRSMSSEDAINLCALMIKIADKRNMINKPLDELDIDASIEESELDLVRDPVVEPEEPETDEDGNELPNKRFYRDLVGHFKEDDEAPAQGSFASVIGRAHTSEEVDEDGEYRSPSGYSRNSYIPINKKRQMSSLKYNRHNNRRYGGKHHSHRRNNSWKNDKLFRSLMLKGGKTTAPIKTRRVSNTRATKRPFTSKPFKMPPELAKYIIKKAEVKSTQKVAKAVEVSNRMVRSLSGKKVVAHRKPVTSTRVVARAPVKKTVTKRVVKRAVKKDNIRKLENSVRRMF